MLFDSLCKTAERNFPKFIPMIKAARLFRVESGSSTEPHEKIDICAWEPDERVVQNFRIPYDTIAIECTCSRHSCGSDCVIVQHVGDPINRRFKFLGVHRKDGPDLMFSGEFTAFPDDIIDVSTHGRTASIHTVELWHDVWPIKRIPSRISDIDISHDRFRPELDNDEKWPSPKEIMASTATDTEKLKKIREVKKLATAECERLEGEVSVLNNTACLLILMATIHAITAINEPAKFILEESPLLMREPRDGNIQRSIYRPQYIVLKPRQIRKLLCLKDPVVEDSEDLGDDPDATEKRKRTPHERRGHFRTLHSERFKNARGRVIWINPQWIGPSEAVVGKNRYRVILEQRD